MEYLPSPALRRILHLQNDVVRSETGGRALLSSNFGGGSNTPRRTEASDFFAAPGRRIAAAGDKLRELIVPDALAQAVSGGKKKRYAEDADLEAARAELDQLVAAVCPLCEGSIVGIDKPFVREDENGGEWAV